MAGRAVGRRTPWARHARRNSADLVYLFEDGSSEGSSLPRIRRTMLYGLARWYRSWSIGEMVSYGGAVNAPGDPATAWSYSRPTNGRTVGMDGFIERMERAGETAC